MDLDEFVSMIPEHLVKLRARIAISRHYRELRQNRVCVLNRAGRGCVILVSTHVDAMSNDIT